MEVILSQDVQRLGSTGQVVKVKDGFARNYLFPHKLAVPMTSANLKLMEQEKARRQTQQEQRRAAARELAAKIAAVSLTLPVLVQEDESLYGAIGAQDIARALADEGIEIDRSVIDLPEPIKGLGVYEVPLRLHPEVSGVVKIWVVKK